MPVRVLMKETPLPRFVDTTAQLCVRLQAFLVTFHPICKPIRNGEYLRLTSRYLHTCIHRSLHLPPHMNLDLRLLLQCQIYDMDLYNIQSNKGCIFKIITPHERVQIACDESQWHNSGRTFSTVSLHIALSLWLHGFRGTNVLAWLTLVSENRQVFLCLAFIESSINDWDVRDLCVHDLN